MSFLKEAQDVNLIEYDKKDHFLEAKITKQENKENIPTFLPLINKKRKRKNISWEKDSKNNDKFDFSKK